MSARPPMRSPRRAERVPGFPASDAETVEQGSPQSVGDSSQPAEAYRNAPLRQFNTRLLDPLHARYRRLVRDLDDEGYRISMTELVHAVLYEGPRTTGEARTLVRAWRRVLDPD